MKKIIAIISACLVAILLGVTVVLACTKYTAATVLEDGAMSVAVYRNGNQAVNEYDSETDEFKKIIRLYNASRKENTLSSLFQGANGFTPEVKNDEVLLSTITTNSDGNYVVVFTYDEIQTLTLNGKDYVNEDSETKETVKYQQMFIEVANTTNFTEYNIYLVDESNANKDIDSNKKSYWHVSLIAHQSDLYAYVATVK